MNFFVCTMRSGCLFSFAFLPQLHHFYLFVVGYVLASRMTILFHRFSHIFFPSFFIDFVYTGNVWNMIGLGMWQNTDFICFEHIEQKDFGFCHIGKKKYNAEKNQPKRILYCYCLWLLPQFIKWQFRIHSMSDCKCKRLLKWMPLYVFYSHFFL